ncbi:MAG: hypothetical protein RML72_03625 [Bacteroidia bacterium]|nr:hypothetical protein [Bacteroidia bacterium]MDW8157951.1 hypothetical protein [Bacteroidia bacterium]
MQRLYTLSNNTLMLTVISVLFFLIAQVHYVFAQEPPVLEGTILLVKPNAMDSVSAVRENLLSLGICCYMGYDNTSEEHILIVAESNSPNGNARIDAAHHKVKQAYPSASIEILSTQAWYRRIGYKYLVTGQKVELKD